MCFHWITEDDDKFDGEKFDWSVKTHKLYLLDVEKYGYDKAKKLEFYRMMNDEFYLKNYAQPEQMEKYLKMQHEDTLENIKKAKQAISW